ncbi:unnamed protein product, partial [Discosporangium mesarthrocarpum]
MIWVTKKEESSKRGMPLSDKIVDQLFTYTRLGRVHHVMKLLEDLPAEVVNSAREDGDTLLHVAAQEEKVAVVEALLDAGADVNSRDSSDGTPLHRSCLSGALESVEVLLDHGSDLEARDVCDFTPLLAACEGGDHEVVELLLRKGADTTAQTNAGATSLHVACAQARCSVVCCLLEHGAGVAALETRDALSRPPALVIGQDGIPGVAPWDLERGGFGLGGDGGSSSYQESYRPMWGEGVGWAGFMGALGVVGAAQSCLSPVTNPVGGATEQRLV